jgi:eukaryotic-like serine/threonine-protein kinase
VTPDRFRLIREIFDEIVELPVAEQRLALQKVAMSEDIRREVEALLDVAADSSHSSRTLISGSLEGMLADVASAKPKQGDQFGAWRVAAEIGQGGMGSVYLVERADGHFAQAAALKLLKGVPSQQRLEYFTRERQTLASLTHPNIARLLDGGAAANGQPFLVMEFIDGTHIDAYCRQQGMGIRAILKLFVTACDAVSFAHRQLVIHCDLKPSNLLVNRQGRPVLLDFGIARLGENPDITPTVPHAAAAGSEALSPAFSPRYASPEQRENGAVSVASDIYSLGVMLRELLQGAVAGDAANNAKSTAGAIDDELAALLKVATADEPAQRYLSVEAFTDDINRYLSNFPLRAMEQSTAYAARKFVRRHSPLVAAAGVLAITVAGFTIKVVTESQRARSAEMEAVAQRDSAARERDRAVVAERQARAERDATKLAEADALKQRDMAALERDRATAAERAVVNEQKLTRAERDRAQSAEKLAVTERDNARDAQRASKEVSDFMVGVFADGSPTAEAGNVSASVLVTRAEARLADASTFSNRPEVKAELFHTLSLIKKRMGAPTEAQKLIQQAIDIQRPLNQPLVLAKYLNDMVDTLNRNGRSREALPAALEAIALLEKHGDPNALGLGLAKSSAGSLLSQAGEMEKAAQMLAAGQVILEKDAPDFTYTAVGLMNLSAHLNRANDFVGAEAAIRRAVDIRTKLWGLAHPATLNSRDSLAFTLRRAGKLGEAESVVRASIEARIKLQGNDNEMLARSRETLASIVFSQNRQSEGIAIYRDALATYERAGEAESQIYVNALTRLGSFEREVGNASAAVEVFTKAVAIMRRRPPPSMGAFVSALRQLGSAQTATGALAEASPHLREAYDLSLAKPGAPNEIVPTLLALIEHQLVANKRVEMNQSLDLLAARLPLKDTGHAAQHERLLGQIAASQQQYEAALKHFLNAESLTAKASGEMALSTWLQKRYRAALLASRNQPGDKAASVALATEIAQQVASKIAPDSPLAGQIAALKQP